MKKKLFVLVSFLAFLTLVFIACKKEVDGGQVGFAHEQGTGGNPDNTSAGSTSSGSTTSTSSIGSTSTTGGTATTTGGGSTTSTSGGSTTSTSGGSTTTPPAGNYFQINSTVYNCTSVYGGAYNGSWSIIGRSAAGDTCSVSFNVMPSAGTYPHTAGLFPAAGECLVAVNIGNSTDVYLGNTGNAVITAPTSPTRKVVITNMVLDDLSSGGSVTLNASMTTP